MKLIKRDLKNLVLFTIILFQKKFNQKKLITKVIKKNSKKLSMLN